MTDHDAILFVEEYLFKSGTRLSNSRDGGVKDTMMNVSRKRGMER